MSPHNSISQSPMLSSSLNATGFSELQWLREELGANKAKLAQWDAGIAQARSVSLKEKFERLFQGNTPLKYTPGGFVKFKMSV